MPGSLEFNASGSYVRNDANLPASTGTMTLCGWAKMLVDRNSEQCIFYLPRYTATATDFALRTDSDGTSLKINANYGSNQSAAHTLVAGDWVFLAVSVSSNTATFYTASEGDTALTTVGSVGITPFAPERLIFGENEGGQWFDGRLSLWRVWNQALSESELLTEFLSRSLVETTDARLEYPMDGGSKANALLDALAGGNDLTEYGSSTTYSTDYPVFTFSEDASETATAGDTVTPVSVILETISESESAGDSVADTAVTQEAVAETGTAADAATDTIVANESMSDAGTASDTVSDSESSPAPAPTPAVHAAPTGRRVPMVHMTYRGRSFVGPVDQVQRAIEQQARLDAQREDKPATRRGSRARAYQRAETLPLVITRVEMPSAQLRSADPELLQAVEAELRRAYQTSMRTALNAAQSQAERYAKKPISAAQRARIETINAAAAAAAERLLLG